MSEHKNRREFIKKATASAIGLGVMGSYGSAAAFGKESANDKVTVAILGTNSRGSQLARGFAKFSGTEIAYICDVDDNAIKNGVEAAKAGGQERVPKGMKDFRKVLDDKSVDAVVIAMPDHWHAPATLMAIQAGKHVYVEKPGSHNPREGEMVAEATKKHNRIVQMGNQRRSWPVVMEALRELKAGVIGNAHFARTWYGANRPSIGFGKNTPVPSNLDFELWQGPAPRRPYRDNLIHYNWHWFWHWGTGELLNNGTHFIDLARLGLGVEYPVKVSSQGGRYAYKDDWQTPDLQIVAYDFAENKTITWEGRSCNSRPIEGLGAALSFHSEQGTMVVGNNFYSVYDNKNVEIKKVTTEEVKISLAGAGVDLDTAHIENFASCIRTGEKPRSVYEDSNKSVLLCHLGNIAHRVGRTLKCNPKDGRIMGDSEAMQLWGREYAQGWEPVV